MQKVGQRKNYLFALRNLSESRNIFLTLQNQLQSFVILGRKVKRIYAYLHKTIAKKSVTRV